MNNNELSADLAKLLEETPELSEVSKKLTKNPIDFDNDPEFISDYLKATFINDVIGAMKEKNMTKTALADKLGKSKQYVGRILNETTNYTIETISEIACALNQEVVLTLRNRNTKTVTFQEGSVIDENQKEINFSFEKPQHEGKYHTYLMPFPFQKTYSY